MRAAERHRCTEAQCGGTRDIVGWCGGGLADASKPIAEAGKALAR